MFCTHCEFEIKGEDRKECPVCGGPLIDFSEVKAASEEITSCGEPDRWEDTPPAPEERAPFDLGKALEADEDYPLQEPEEESPLSFFVEPEPQSETTAEEPPAEDAAATGFDKSRGEPGRWEDIPPAPEERASFDLGKALEADEDYPLQEPEEPPLMPFQSEAELPVEAVDTPQSPEEVTHDIPDSDTIPPEQIIAPEQQTELSPTHSSRQQLALSVMGVLALVAAITTIAIFKPQQNLVPDIGPLTIKTEKTVKKILRTIMQKEEEKIVTQKTSEQITPLKQRQKKYTAGKGDPDKKQSQLEKISKTHHLKPLAQQATDHTIIASLQAPSSLFGKKEVQSLEKKPSTKNRLERETVPVTPLTKKTSQSTLYSIHTGSFKNKEVAASETDRLKKMGFRAYIQRVDLANGQTWHRIKIGSYSTREEAEKKQNLLRQKEPKLKSYIMRRVTETHNTGTKREDKTPIATGITPSISGQNKREHPHAQSDVPESISPLKKILTPEGERPIIGMETASYQTPVPGEGLQTVPPGEETLLLIKENFVLEIEELVTEMKAAPYLIPPSDEAPQAVSEGGATLPLLKGHVAPELEQLITEMAGNPFTTLLVGKEIPPEDAGVIGTTPAELQEHISTGNTVSEDILYGGEKTVTPGE